MDLSQGSLRLFTIIIASLPWSVHILVVKERMFALEALLSLEIKAGWGVWVWEGAVVAFRRWSVNGWGWRPAAFQLAGVGVGGEEMAPGPRRVQGSCGEAGSGPCQAPRRKWGQQGFSSRVGKCLWRLLDVIVKSPSYNGSWAQPCTVWSRSASS